MKKRIFAGIYAALVFCAFGLTACGEDEELRFTLSDDGEYYICEAARAADETITSVEIPSVYNGKPVAKIGHFGFISVTNLTIPDSVKVIGEQAFSGCAALESVTIGSGVTLIKSYAFAGCDALESISIPDGVTEMEEHVFEQCASLKEVKFGKGIKTIKPLTFLLCPNLKSISLPDNIETLEDMAFERCGIESISFGKGVTSIGAYAFRECKNLKSIALPNSLTTLGDFAFFDCENMETIEYSGRGLSRFEDNTFRDCNKLKGIFTKLSPDGWRESGLLSPMELYFYSWSQPIDDDYFYWHYVDGEITVWE